MSALGKWDPFKELDYLQNRIGHLFDHNNSNQKPAESSSETDLSRADWAPVVDITEDDHGYQIEAELPRVKKKDVKLRVANGQLSISGERSFKREEKDDAKKYHRVERSYGRFVRSFRLPEDVEADQVKAEFSEGVLTVSIPKSEKSKPKEIDIKIS
ncbi:MAG: Hsp20/alpha crystallin family protein [Verrucomicrobiota bacterium]